MQTVKQMIKNGILDIYEDVQLFEEEIKNCKRVNEEKEAMEKAAAAKYAKLLLVCTSNITRTLTVGLLCR